VDLDFYGEGRANVAALDDGAANPDVAGEVHSFEGIVECAAAGIADERVRGGAKIVVLAQLVQILDELERASAARRLMREGPVTCRERGRAGRKADYGGRNVFAGGEVADEEVRRRPGLGKVCDIRDNRMGFVRMWQQGSRVRRGRRNFNLGRGLDAYRCDRLGMSEPAHRQKKQYAKNDDTSNERKKRVRARSARRRRHTGDLRHVCLIARS